MAGDISWDGLCYRLRLIGGVDVGACHWGGDFWGAESRIEVGLYDFLFALSFSPTDDGDADENEEGDDAAHNDANFSPDTEAT